ncbi:hypothetical protein [Citrobacter freundii]|uniref:Putative Phage protein n=1 Tax=uncultured Citrobacter sp. TaxID=200446 RepID=A0A212I986_9ENTR|nr:hypothetical protein [Citrobacter freundii]MBJ9533529.1 hypothetical protein [Citrobacter freundii]MDU1172781.1 hypothetical protein [Citrobacter freundii]MDU1221560.1 hypothetical protein [Citrobacter freundii]QLZ07113.1 hypothetical protein HV103_10200 [Citrobacter freundii]SBV63353.1 putative Phage protein [uncultured Citrobacter sp.]
MKTLATNNDFDIYLDNSRNLAIATGLQAVIQTCEHVARTKLTELPYAQSRGIPFFDIALGSQPDVSLYDMFLRKVYKTVPGVEGVGNINFAKDGDTLSYTAQIRTIYGTESASGII